MRNYIMILFAIMAIIGCDKEKVDPINVVPIDEGGLFVVDGSWSLKTFSGGVAGVNENWEQGEIHWTFNNETSEVGVVNNTESSFSFDTGIYTYAVIQVDEDFYLEVSGVQMGKVSIVDDNLLLDGSISPDGPISDAFSLLFEPYYLTQQIWNLIHITGGLAGVDINIESGLFTFDFDQITETVVIVNDTEEGVFTFASGTYDYTIIVVGSNQYLNIEDSFTGQITLYGEQMLINGNELPSGSGDDFFSFVLE